MGEGGQECADTHPDDCPEIDVPTTDPVGQRQNQKRGNRSEPHIGDKGRHFALVQIEGLANLFESRREHRKVVTLEEYRDRNDTDQPEMFFAQT